MSYINSLITLHLAFISALFLVHNTTNQLHTDKLLASFTWQWQCCCDSSFVLKSQSLQLAA